MADVIDSLFGPTPFQIQQAQNQALGQAADKYAAQDPFARAAGQLYRGGGMLAGAVAPSFGLVNPDQQQAAMRHAVMAAGGDLSTAAGLKAKAAQFDKMGDQATALRLLMAARAMEKEEQAAELQKAHAQYYREAASRRNDVSNTQLAAKLAVARNDAWRQAQQLGYSGQDAVDFVEQRVQQVRDDWMAATQSGVAGEVQISPTTSVSAGLTLTQEQKDAAIADAKRRGDMEAATRLEAMPVKKPIAMPKSKAEVAGEVESAKVSAQQNPEVLARASSAKEAGKGAAESNEKLYSQAKAAEAIIPKIDRGLKEIENSKFKPGIFSEFRLAVEKAKASLGGAKAAGAASDAEILNALMGQDVFALLGAMGLGSKQMDTPAERDFMRQVLAGTINMERGALKRLAQIRKDDAMAVIDRYNKKLDAGELDNFLKDTSRTKERIKASQRPMTIDERMAKYLKDQ